MTGRVDLDDLELFVLVARHGSIGAAAAEHGLSQPSVSRRMASFERAVGVPLLTRTRRGSALTPGGEVVVGWAETLLVGADDFARSVETLRSGRRSAVRAAVSLTVAEHLAPGWLAAVHERYPDLRVALEVHNSTDVADLVERGAADIGFVETPRVRRELRRRKVGDDRLVVAVSPEHPWARRRTPLAARDLAAAYLLVREPGSGTRDTFDLALRSHGLELADGMALGSNTALRSAAVSGIGPVVLSALALADDLGGGRLVEVQVRDLDLRRPFTAVWRKDIDLDDGARALLAAASA